MRRNKAGLLGLLLLGMPVLASVACGLFQPEPTPTPIPTPTAIPTATPLPTPTPVPFTAITFNVPAGQEHETRLQAGVGYLIEFRFDSDSDINVSLYDPHGYEVGRWHRLESHSGVQHIAEKNGVYVLRFDNSFSVFTSKRVSVTMRVVPPRGR